MATPKFNSKSPTIRRIRKFLHHPPPSLLDSRTDTRSTHRSPRSPRNIRFALTRLHSHSARIRPLRMALYPPRPPQFSLRRRHLPRSHRSPTSLPTTPSILPLRHTVWTLRSQPRNLSFHQRPPRRNMAARMGSTHCAGRPAFLHGDRSKGATGRS